MGDHGQSDRETNISNHMNIIFVTFNQLAPAIALLNTMRVDTETFD